VGKSSIVKRISSAKSILVQEYPFTTKKLILGHLEIQRRFDSVKLQIMDSPGILDRPLSERNNIEMQAILALRLISDLILFIFDPTPACGYNIESQINLFNEVKRDFIKNKDIQIKIIFNKMDLSSQQEIEYLQNTLGLNKEDYILTNALTGENIELILSYLRSQYAEPIEIK
jgi:nucleolar GTP-binding protein